MVPGAMIAVPLAEPSGIGPAGLLVNKSSSSAWLMASSCATSKGTFPSFNSGKGPLFGPSNVQTLALYTRRHDSVQLFFGLLCIRQNHLRCLLANHVDRTGDEEAWNAGKYRSVHHTQTESVVYAKTAGEHAVLFRRPDRAGAGSMVPPAVVADEIS